MGPTPKIIGVMSCSVVLCLSLSNATQATANMKPDACADRKGGLSNPMKCDDETRQSVDTVTGEVLDIGGNLYLVQEQDGGLFVLHTDSNTQGTETVGRGDQIEAKVRDANDRMLVLSIRQLK